MLNIIFTFLQFCFLTLVLLNWILVPNSLINAIALIFGLIGFAIIEKVRKWE